MQTFDQHLVFFDELMLFTNSDVISHVGLKVTYRNKSSHKIK